MTLFRRNKHKPIRKHKKVDESPPEKPSTRRQPWRGSTGSKPVSEAFSETSPQRVGVVSGILSTPAGSEGLSQYASVIERRFGPDPDREAIAKDRNSRPIEPILDEVQEFHRLEVDPMAHIGPATTITGNIVAEEDLEIQGTIEGSVRLANHQLTVGIDGIAKASVEAHTVVVFGKITGNVVAAELVEIKAGGVIGGDVKAPRVIMNDGGIVVGALDMSAALPRSAETRDVDPPAPKRPRLMKVEWTEEAASSEIDGV